MFSLGGEVMGAKGPKAEKVVNPITYRSMKFPLNPDVDIPRIRSLVSIALMETAKPFDKSNGGEWARLEGVCEHALKEIAKELGVMV